MGAPLDHGTMNLAASYRQRTRSVEHVNFTRQIVMGAEIAIELGAMALLDDQDTLLAVKRGGKALRLCRREQAQREQARVDAVAGGMLSRLTSSAGERAPGHHREIAGTLPRCPVVSEIETVELVAALV